MNRKKLFNQIRKFSLRMKGNYYKKSIITILLLASLPGIIIGFTMFLIGKGQIENELQQIHETHLNDTMETIDDQFTHLELIMAYWAVSPQFNSDLRNLDFVYRYKEIHAIYQTLTVMEGSNPLIKKAEFFLDAEAPIVFASDRYSRLNNNQTIKHYRSLLKNGRNIYWSENPSSLQLVYKIQEGAESPFGVLIISLDKNKINELLATPYEMGTSFLYKGNDQWYFGKENKGTPSKLDKAVLSEVIERKEKTGTFIQEWDANEFSVTHRSLNRLGTGWHYVSAAPLTTITQPVIFVSKLIVVISCIILIIAILLSWVASRKLYSPIEKLVKQINSQEDSPSNWAMKNEFDLIEYQWNSLSQAHHQLRDKLESNLPHLREGFLMQLLQGYLYTFSEPVLRERMEKLGWDVEGRTHMTIFVQLLGFFKLEGQFAKGDEGLITFMVENVVKELIHENNLKADVINFHDLSLGILVSWPQKTTREEMDLQVYPFCEQIIKCVSEILQVDSVISMSRTTDSLKTIPALFEEAKMSVSFRSLQEVNHIIDMETIDSFEENPVDYPFDIEKNIVNAVYMGKETNALELLREYMNWLSENNLNEAVMKQRMFHLLGSILQIAMQARLNSKFIYQGASFYEQLNQMRELDEIAAWFEKSIIRPIIKELSTNQDSKMGLMVEKVVFFLQENYMRPDISLDYCADQVDVNSYVLSKAFKKVTGESFTDYLTNVRLNKARELLAQTDMRVSEVAEKVGYQNSYFNRIFKKHEGVTPGQYREKSSQER